MFGLKALLALLLANDIAAKFVDLTYNINPDIMRWPGTLPYKSTVAYYGPVLGVPFVASNNFETTEHIGTHIDTPYHFAKNGRKLHEIPFADLHGAAVVIDIRNKTVDNRDYAITVEDLQAWETQHNQPIPHGAVIVMNSGWGAYWGNQSAFLGSNNTTMLHFPGFGAPAVKWAIDNRNVKGFVTDAVSCDVGQATGFPAHQAVCDAGKWCVENAANVERIPATGSEIYAMPIKIENGTGAPIRLYAVWDHVNPWHVGDAGSLVVHSVLALLAGLVAKYLLTS
ncbi:unnamed protein product [Owenia fusiformis]|uniref:Cyclase n=1 Tax=Owenia fusiformis TaxID=6347 RepID=A0A8S4PXU1_OWEFU|nr:unnamed protein product [Owenia fusiformis]